MLRDQPIAEPLNATPEVDCFPSPYAILRFSTLPMRQLSPLRCTETVACFRRLLELEAWFDGQRDSLSDVLYRAVPTVTDQAARRILLNIRRAMFNDRAHKGGIAAMRQLFPHLERPVRAVIVRWYRMTQRYQRLQLRLNAMFAAELHDRRTELRALCSRDDFLKGVLVSSIEFYDALRLYLAAPQEQSSELSQIEISAMLYLSRMAAKPSPFASFTPTALGAFDPKGPVGLQADLRGPIQSRPRLNTAIIHLIARYLNRLPEIKASLSVSVRDSLWIEDNKICFLRPYYVFTSFFSRQDLVHRLPALPAIQRIIQLVRERGSCVYQELVQLLSNGISTAEPAVCKALDNLIDQGLLICQLPFTAHDETPLITLVQLLQPYHDPLIVRCREQLQEITALFAGYQSAGHTERRTLTKVLQAAFDTLTETLTIPTSYTKSLDLIHEDCAIAGETFQVGAEVWEAVQEQLVPLLEHFELGHLQHTPGLLQFFEERVGVGGTCTDIMAFMARFGAYQDELLTRLDSRYDTIAPILKKASALTYQLNGIALTLWQQRDQAASSLVELDLPALPRSVPPLRGWPASATVFVQLAAASEDAWRRGDYLLILNQTYNGLGSYAARYCGLYGTDLEPDPLTIRLQEYFASMSKHVELMDLPLMTDSSDLQLHPRLTNRDFGWPVDPADSQTVAISAFDLQHDPERKALHIIERGTNREVVPLYLGAVYPLVMPQPARGLINALTPTCYPYGREFWNRPPMAAADSAAPTAIRHLPRVQSGRVVLARESWQVCHDQIPKPEKGEADVSYFWRVYRWKEKIGLPDVLFVRADVKIYNPLMKHRHKPLYLDFQNPWSIFSLPRLLDDDVESLIFTEMLPTSEQLPVSFNDEPVVSEVQIELNWMERFSWE